MKNKQVKLTTAITTAAITLFIGLITGINWIDLSTKFGPYLGLRPDANIDFSDLNDVYHTLTRHFDGTLTKEDALEGAKRGLVGAAGDPYTYYMSKTEASDFFRDLSGDVGAGVGIELGERDGWVKVLRTLEGNPARAAGILAGDIIYKVNGENVTTLTSDKVAEKIRGDIGSVVVLTLVRDNKELEFTITRERINNVSAYVTYQGDVAILTLSRFDSDTGTLTRRLAKEIIDHGSTKIILDLRGNGGGYVTAARDVASLWIDGDLVVTQKTELGFQAKDTYANRGQAVLKNLPTVVLVNGATASASEIVAGALKDYDLATIIGEKSFGKGSMQELLELRHGGLLRVTIARWYTPKGISIDHSGITPDIEVARSFDDINRDIDPQLQKALDTLSNL